MTPEALWSFEFLDNEENQGGGVAVFYRNHVYGGNNGFTYVGEYLLKGDEIQFKVNIKRFNDEVPGVYKDEYDFSASGKYHDLEFIVTGSPDDNEDLIMAVQCTRQADITYR